MLKYLEMETLDDEVKEGLVLVDFYAEWCGPCKMLGPVLEEFAKEHEDIKVVKVDIDQHENLAREYGIMSVPTMLLFQDGKVVKQNVGYVPKELLETWVMGE